MKNQIFSGLVASLSILTMTACVGAVNVPAGANTNTNADAGGSTRLESLLSQVNSRENIVSSLEVTELLSFYSTTSQTVSIQNEGRQFTAVINGKTYLFPRTDGSSANGVDSPLTRSNYLIRRQKYVDDVLDSNIRNNYILFNYGVFNDTTRRISFGFAVTGIPTAPNAIPTTASATYSGGTIIHSNTFDSPVRTVLLYGDVEMNVNFSSRRISGDITNIEDFDGIYPIPQNAIILFNETAFGRDGRYNGRLTLGSSFAEAVGVTSITRGTYRGATYGSDAGSLAGVLNVDGVTRDGDQFRAIAGFYADR